MWMDATQRLTTACSPNIHKFLMLSLAVLEHKVLAGVEIWGLCPWLSTIARLWHWCGWLAGWLAPSGLSSNIPSAIGFTSASHIQAVCVSLLSSHVLWAFPFWWQGFSPQGRKTLLWVCGQERGSSLPHFNFNLDAIWHKSQSHLNKKTFSLSQAT